MQKDDLINLKKYARYAVLAPDNIKKTIFLLGYEEHSIDTLNAKSFNDLFVNINNNGRFWERHIEAEIMTRLNDLDTFYGQYFQSICAALDKLFDLITQANMASPAINKYASIDYDTRKIIKEVHALALNCWTELEYETAKNNYTQGVLDLFKTISKETKDDINKKLKFIDYVEDNRLKALLSNLDNDFKFISKFSAVAQMSITNLWAKWLELLLIMSDVSSSAGKVDSHSDIFDLYNALDGAKVSIESVHKSCLGVYDSLKQAEHDYANDYPAGFIPIGEYLEASKDVKLTLKGQCKNKDGHFYDFEFDLTQCDPMSTELIYHEGELKLESQTPTITGYCHFPGGNYAEHCEHLTVELSAMCVSKDGHYHASSLNLSRQLYPQIINDNGSLKQTVSL